VLNPGIVSAPARLQGKGLQMDSRMNYGNVGGPLVDLEGRFVGVTCKVDVKFAASFGQNSGVSFAVTWDKLNELLPDLKNGAKVRGTGAPFLGVQWNQNVDEPDGVPIESVVPGGSAEAGGLKPGDVILEFGGTRVKSFDDLREIINKKSVGDKVKIRFRRGEDELGRSREADRRDVPRRVQRPRRDAGQLRQPGGPARPWRRAAGIARRAVAGRGEPDGVP
jgi:S1-C subfamily serine protease